MAQAAEKSSQKSDTIPRRHQRSRKKGSRLPEGVVCVTRPGKWGNPFSDAETFRTHLKLALDGNICQESDKSIESIAKNINELRGKDLACWCALDQPCHADVLLEFANQRQEASPQASTPVDISDELDELRFVLAEVQR
jgi:hypothetical protein